jgi:hypothetical protein
LEQSMAVLSGWMLAHGLVVELDEWLVSGLEHEMVYE